MPPHSPTLDQVHWDRLFEDLEGQLASEWEAERAALDAESERLRISRIELKSRLRMLCVAEASVSFDLSDGSRMPAVVRALGMDWVAAESAAEGMSRSTTATQIVPLHAVHGIRTDHGRLLASLEADADAEPALRERMTFGFVLRDLARRRVPVRITRPAGPVLNGTIDRAGVDHLDLAEHDLEQPRVADAIHAFRIIPFDAIVTVRIGSDQLR